MDGSTARRVRIREWVRRYLPCEVAGTVGEFGAAALVYVATDSLGAAAVAASVGASGGYYAVAYLSALRWSYRDQAHRPALARLLMANLLALRSVAIEFGPAEVIDSIAVRPLGFYLGPALFGNVAAGWIFGKLVSDVAFYTCAVFSYERFKLLVAQSVPSIEEGDHESATTISAA
ncbi:hypothetical protein [Mycolicibacterium psychrotolerans]|uniref:GtrA-like protein domain-containing protein n=1 Tax=Mycolicibacterium psychrotolerans TaxID=216929 RepID=A0A7I7M8M1_9MYCO|nr:hypothetical protein [Mycolicibacterium psychrotolerans]BBX68525.1 hypothetical protein MPSYJ_19860 [Mycolicibacterium psychrotolerans]